MALTPQRRIEILAERLLSKHLGDIDQETFALRIQQLSQREWDLLQQSLVSGATRTIGEQLYRIFVGDARRAAVAEATNMWRDNTLDEAEFDRVFE